MNKEQKAAVVEEVARDLREAQAVIAVDYRGISVKQSADLRAQLVDAGARFRVVKNRLTQRAADEAGVSDQLGEFLEGPTALTFVPAEGGDAATAAKALAAFRREHGLPEFKGGAMDGQPLTAADIDALSRLPARDVLYGQLVGITASPITGLVRTLNALVSGLAIQLGAIRDQGLVSGDAPAEESDGDTSADDSGGEAPAEDGGGESEADDSPAAASDGDGEAEGAGDSADGGDSGDGGDSADEVAEAALTEDESSDSTEAPSASEGDSDDEVAAAATEDTAEDDPSVSSPADEAPGDPVAEAATAEQDEQDDQETSE